VTSLAFVVPGPLDQLTGGYLFDRRIVDGLRATGRSVAVHELSGSFPDCDATARNAAAALLTALPDSAVAVIDGLALPAFAECLTAETAARLRLMGFVHHTLALETGLNSAESQRYAALEQRLLPRLRGVLCPSAVTAWAVEEYGVPRERIAVTPPGTEKPASLPRRAPRTGSPQLLCVAALTPRKGHLLLIEALAALADRAWRLTCIGSVTRDRATATAVEAAIARHGLVPRVLLAGEWPPARLGAAYAEADIFVLPSHYEGYGMAFAEALAHGLPIIGTTGGAIPETVPAEAAMLVPPDDREALVAALRMVLDQADLRDRLAQGAARAAAALPDWPQAVRRWMEALDRLAA
jgi:glycosyltransferase involved in cell wall biosynthesis